MSVRLQDQPRAERQVARLARLLGASWKHGSPGTFTFRLTGPNGISALVTQEQLLDDALPDLAAIYRPFLEDAA